MKACRRKPIAGALAGLWLCWSHAPASAQDFCAPSEATDPQPLHIDGSNPFVYKTVGGAELRLHVFTPAQRPAGVRSPAAVFFFGGGWIFGDIRRFQTQATHLALAGLVTVLVDYRVKCRHGATILDEVADAKSAMRWVRRHAGELGVDPSRIAAVGSSAGGQLAAAAALVPGFDDPADPKIDPRPNALILYNPALDLSSEAAIDGLSRFVGREGAESARAASPIDHLDQGLPPTIIFQGTADKLVDPATADAFCARARALGSRCDVVSYAGAPHGFAEVWLGLEDASVASKTEAWALDTSRQTDAFLARLGWLPASPAPRPLDQKPRERLP
jgi:acetyl esterase/lipase